MSEKTKELMAEHKNLAMAKLHFQGDIQSLTKGSSVEFNGKKQYDYVDLATLLDYALPILSRHGLLLEQFNIERDVSNVKETRAADGSSTKETHYVRTMVGIKTVLVHPVSGESQSNELFDTSDIKDIKARGGMITYLRRYSALTILQLSAEDDDAGSGGAPKKLGERSPDPEQKPAQRSAPPAKKPEGATKKTDAEIKKEFDDLGLNDTNVQKALAAVSINTMLAAIAFRKKYESTAQMMDAIEGGV